MDVKYAIFSKIFQLDLNRDGDGDMVLTHVLDIHGALLAVLGVLHLLVQGLTPAHNLF